MVSSAKRWGSAVCFQTVPSSKLQDYVSHSNPVFPFHYIFTFQKILNIKVYWILTDKLKVTLKTNKQKQRLLESYDPQKAKREQFEHKEWSWNHKTLLKLECINLEIDLNLSLSRMGMLWRYVTWVVYNAKLSLLVWIQECCRTTEWAHPQVRLSHSTTCSSILCIFSYYNFSSFSFSRKVQNKSVFVCFKTNFCSKQINFSFESNYIFTFAKCDFTVVTTKLLSHVTTITEPWSLYIGLIEAINI